MWKTVVYIAAGGAFAFVALYFLLKAGANELLVFEEEEEEGIEL